MSPTGTSALPIVNERGYRESYERTAEVITKTVRLGDCAVSRASLPDIAQLPTGAPISTQFEVARLRNRALNEIDTSVPLLTTVDAFSGCGGLTLGLHDAVSAAGYRAECRLAFDLNEAAAEVFIDNFQPVRFLHEPIEEVISGDLGRPKNASERALALDAGSVDILVGGPPCQGHSDLNNHSRRNDPKNALYGRMGRLAEVLLPSIIVIENVPGAVHDRGRIVQRTQEHLRNLGYTITGVALHADDFGAAQKRRRHFTIAVKGGDSYAVEATLKSLSTPTPTIMDAIGDLRTINSSTTFDSSAKHSAANIRRIDYLFDHDLYELPDSERPDCHRLKPHTYNSVYGRLYPDRPAPTITSGFGSTGQGRFVHPMERRTLTPHEAARVQGFPDSFDFSAAQGRRALQEMIGNAVPYRLAYSVCLAAIAGRQ